MAHIDLDDHILAQVRDASDIVEVVSQITPLKAAGKSHKGLCPFHREKTPSFHVDRGKGLFYCFGCGAGGDVFKFLMLAERYTFPEVVEHLASRAGITLPRKSSRTEGEARRDDLLQLIEEASRAYHQALEWKPNPAAAYLDQRGVSDEIRKKYGFGFAPDSWDYVLSRLGRRFSVELLEKAGLVLPRKSGSGHYDRFRNRLMVPIHSENGTVVGFGGRALDGSEPKYLNSPESPVFNKSQILYNLHRARQRIRRDERAILVEGYFDCIALDHAGVGGVVASMGTSLTAGQASMFRRLAKRVIVFYDGDNAGQEAMLRAAPVLLSAGLGVEIVSVSEGEDPDTVLEKSGLEGTMEAIANAVDVFEFALMRRAADPGAMTGSEKRAALDDLMPLLTSVADPVLRVDASQRVADHLRLPYEAVGGQLSGGPRRQSEVIPDRVAPINTGEKLVLRAILRGEMPDEILGRIRPELFEGPVERKIFESIHGQLRDGQPLDFSAIATHLRSESELTRLSELALDDERSGVEAWSLDQTVRLMERRNCESRLRELQSLIQEATGQGDPSQIEALMQEKHQLSRELVALSALK